MATETTQGISHAQRIANTRAFLERIGVTITAKHVGIIRAQADTYAQSARKLRLYVRVRPTVTKYRYQRAGALKSARAFYALAREAERTAR